KAAWREAAGVRAGEAAPAAGAGPERSGLSVCRRADAHAGLGIRGRPSTCGSVAAAIEIQAGLRGNTRKAIEGLRVETHVSLGDHRQLRRGCHHAVPLGVGFELRRRDLASCRIKLARPARKADIDYILSDA